MGKGRLNPNVLFLKNAVWSFVVNLHEMTHQIHRIVLGKMRVGGFASERHTQRTISPCKMLLLLQFSFACLKSNVPFYFSSTICISIIHTELGFHFYFPFVTCFYSPHFSSCSLPFLYLTLKWGPHVMGTVP